MPSNTSKEKILLRYLKQIEPNATFTPVHNGYRSSSGSTYIAKVGSSKEIDKYVAEAESLKAIHLAAPGLAPKLLSNGIDDDSGLPYFISEKNDLSPLTDNAARRLGVRMATELHMHKSTKGFGFSVPTYCGETRLENGWYKSWEACFDGLIGGLLDKLDDRGGFGKIVEKGQQVRSLVIPKLLGKLAIQPVLLHGDLWGGNVGVDKKTGEPVIFDPASYFGHNEADLAISRMFWGFPASFYEAYHEMHDKNDPVEEYEQRGDLYELFHYLNHMVIFGGTYATGSLGKMDKLLRWSSNRIIIQ